MVAGLHAFIWRLSRLQYGVVSRLVPAAVVGSIIITHAPYLSHLDADHLHCDYPLNHPIHLHICTHPTTAFPLPSDVSRINSVYELRLKPQDLTDMSLTFPRHGCIITTLPQLRSHQH